LGKGNSSFLNEVGTPSPRGDNSKRVGENSSPEPASQYQPNICKSSLGKENLTFFFKKGPGSLLRTDNHKIAKSSSQEPLDQKSLNLHERFLIQYKRMFVKIMARGWGEPQYGKLFLHVFT
jgi:hypothetical protein